MNVLNYVFENEQAMFERNRVGLINTVKNTVLAAPAWKIYYPDELDRYQAIYYYLSGVLMACVCLTPSGNYKEIEDLVNEYAEKIRVLNNA